MKILPGLRRNAGTARKTTTNTDNLKWVKNLLMDWAERELRIMSGSTIGYPPQSAEGRIMNPSLLGFVPPGPHHPEVMMSPRISDCDRAVKALKPELRLVIRYKYESYGTELERAKRYMADTGEGRATYYRRLERAHKTVSDWIWRNA